MQNQINEIMTTALQIFNYIQALNAKTNVISSMGEGLTPESKSTAYFYKSEIGNYITKGSLANKIMLTNEIFTEKQLWVITYDLVKNSAFCKMVAEFYNDLNDRVAAEKAHKAAKKAAKKANQVVVEKNFAETCGIEGRKVAHATFGQGVVISENDATITVNFSGVEKQLLKKFAKLTNI